MKKLIAVLLVSVFALTACGGSGGKVTNLNTTDFAAKASDPAVIVLDVRRPDEFAAGHLKNAVLLNYESGTFSEDITKLDKSKTYAVYCHSGRRSGLATSEMAKVGFNHVYNLDGGISGWMAAGQPVVNN